METSQNQPATEPVVLQTPLAPVVEQAQDQSKAIVDPVVLARSILVTLQSGHEVKPSDVVAAGSAGCIIIARDLITAGKTVPKLIAKTCDKAALAEVRETRKNHLRETGAPLISKMIEQGWKLNKLGDIRSLRNGDRKVAFEMVQPKVKIITKGELEASISKMTPDEIAQFQAVFAKAVKPESAPTDIKTETVA